MPWTCAKARAVRKLFRCFLGARRVVHRTVPLSTEIPTDLPQRWIILWIHTAGRSRRPAAPSNAAATSSSRRSRPCGPTSWRPTGSPSSVVPAGTEIAGQPVTVIRYAERIQSRYVSTGRPLIAAGNSWSAGNGGTCDTGSASTSHDVKKARIVSESAVRWA